VSTLRSTNDGRHRRDAALRRSMPSTSTQSFHRGDFGFFIADAESSVMSDDGRLWLGSDDGRSSARRVD